MRAASLLFSRYIARQFMISIGLVLAILTGIIVLFDAVELVRRSYGHDMPFSIVIQMVLLKLPSILQEVIPFTVLIGGMLCFARLTRSLELVVARSAGLSAWQFLSPAVLSALAIGIFITTIFNPMAAIMLSGYEKLEARYLHGSTSMLAVSSTGLWMRQQNVDEGGKTVIHALRASHEDMTLYDILVLVLDQDNKFIRRIDADSATLKAGYWHIKNAVLTRPGMTAEREENFMLPTSLSSNQLQDSFASPETMSFWELPAFIKALKEAGFSALRHELHWHRVMTLPFFLSAMVMIAAAFSLRLPRRGKTGMLFALGIFVGYVIYFLSDLVSALGLSGSIPVLMAAWMPVLISMLFGFVLLLHLEDG